MSPDARVSAMRRFDPALGRRRVDHPAGGHHGRVPQRGVLHGLLQGLYLALEVSHAARSRRSACSRLGCRPESSHAPRELCDLALQLLDALLHAVHKYVRLHGELLCPELEIGRREGR